MNQSIVATKCMPPPPPRTYLPRARLNAVWDGMDALRLLLVTAGAGYGKTTFLSANARCSRRPVAWLTLDEHDVDPAFFVAHLLYALRPGLESSASGWDASAGDYLPRALALIVGELHKADEGRVLILDDVHALGPDSKVSAFLGRLARYLPGGCSLVLASREPVFGKAMKLRGEVAVADLNACDLALDATEVAGLHARHGRGELNSETAAAVVERTEGWPAGVEILFQSLGTGRDDPGLEESLEAGLGEDGWFSYFAEEVLRGLDDDARDFLLRSSVLPELDCDLCDAVLEIDDSRRHLDALSKRHLFTLRLDARGCCYRYHHLFRDFLRTRLADTMSAGAVRTLQRRAAGLLCERDAWIEALAAADDAVDHALILKIAGAHGDELFASGRFETIRSALSGAPLKSLGKKPQALKVFGQAHEALGAWDEAEKTYRRALAAATSGKMRVEIMSLIAQLKQRQGKSKPCIKLCRDALAEPGRIDNITRGGLLNMLGVACCDLGQLDKGERHLREAVEAYGPQLSRDESARLFYLLETNIHYRRGDFQLAKTTARRALGAFRKQGDALRICHSLGVLAHITADCCEIREARDLAFECLRMAESLEYHLMEGYAHLALGSCATLNEDHDRAREHFRRASDLGERLGEQGLSGLPVMALAENAWRRGRKHEARTLARRVLNESENGRDVYLEVRALTLLGRLAHRRKPREARALWDRAEQITERVGMHFDHNRLLTIRALHDENPNDLDRLLKGVATYGHEFLLTIVERKAAPSLLAAGLRMDEHVSTATRMLETLGDEASDALAPLLKVESCAERVQETLARIDGPRARALITGPAPAASASDKEEIDGAPLRIHALGQLVVETGEHRLTMREWRSARALRLFQILLTRRFHWIPSDVVIEMLWPECDLRKGRNNLRQTIHVLRRTLQPDLKAPRASSYVRHHQDAIRLDPGEDYDYDLEDCEEALDAAEVAWSEGRPDDAHAAVDRACAIYTGPFLEESPYEEYAAVEGEQIRDRFLRNLERMARSLSSEREWNDLVPLCRRILGLDPYQESAHAFLVHALAELGHRQEALAAYEKYEAIMVRELDLLPSTRMKALAESIAAR